MLANAPADYSAKYEVALLRSGRSGLPVVFSTPDLTIYAVSSPQPIVTGPGHPAVRKVTESTITLALSEPGRYQLGIRYTPYLAAPKSCVSEAKDGMTVLTAPTAGTVKLSIGVSASGALAALTGSRTTCPKEH